MIKKMRLQPVFAIAAVFFMSASVSAQTRSTQTQRQDDAWEQPAPASRANQAGNTANTAAGKVGERQATRGQAIGAQPMARIDSRIQNRVNSRIQSRIDKNYQSQASTADPFAVAEEQARSPRRR